MYTLNDLRLQFYILQWNESFIWPKGQLNFVESFIRGKLINSVQLLFGNSLICISFNNLVFSHKYEYLILNLHSFINLRTLLKTTRTDQTYTSNSAEYLLCFRSRGILKGNKTKMELSICLGSVIFKTGHLWQYKTFSNSSFILCKLGFSKKIFTEKCVIFTFWKSH